MHYRLFCIALVLTGTPCRCIALQQEYMSNRGQGLCETGRADGQICSPMSASLVQDILRKLGMYPELPVVPLPSIPTARSMNPPTAANTAAMPPASSSSGTRPTAFPQPRLSQLESQLPKGFIVREHHHLHRRDHKKEQEHPVAITFGVLGASVGVIVLILCWRSVRHYYRTPKRNRVAEHIDRYNLERELTEIERARLGFLFPQGEEPSTQPPPPYLEAPKYEDATKNSCV